MKSSSPDMIEEHLLGRSRRWWPRRRSSSTSQAEGIAANISFCFLAATSCHIGVVDWDMASDTTWLQNNEQERRKEQER